MSFSVDLGHPSWLSTHVLIRPPDIPVGGLTFYHGFFFLLSSFFFRRLISDLAERQPTKIGHMFGSNCDLRTHVQNPVYPLPLQIKGPKATFFGRLHKFNGLYIRNGYRQSVKCVDNYEGLLHCPKMSWTLAHKRLQTRPAFYPPAVNSGFHFIVRFRRQRSANGTKPNFAKRWMVGRANHLP